jgi:hypothetical protein
VRKTRIKSQETRKRRPLTADGRPRKAVKRRHGEEKNQEKERISEQSEKKYMGKWVDE